jgi:RIO-like serine/threonine protein kinase
MEDINDLARKMIRDQVARRRHHAKLERSGTAVRQCARQEVERLRHLVFSGVEVPGGREVQRD